MNRLQNCSIEHTPDLPPHRPLSSFSNAELKNKLVSSIRNDYRWRTPGKLPTPRVVSMNFGQASAGDALVEPKLLPGAKEMLSIQNGRLELWSIEDQVMLWAAPASVETYVCLGYEFELLEGGELRIAMIDAEEGFSQTCMLQVLSVDMEHMRHTRLYVSGMPWGFFFRMMMKGDVLLVPLPASGSETLLVNWRTGGKLILDHRESTVRSRRIDLSLP